MGSESLKERQIAQAARKRKPHFLRRADSRFRRAHHGSGVISFVLTTGPGAESVATRSADILNSTPRLRARRRFSCGARFAAAEIRSPRRSNDVRHRRSQICSKTSWSATPRFICDQTPSDPTKSWRVRHRPQDRQDQGRRSEAPRCRGTPPIAQRIRRIRRTSRALLSKMMNLAKKWEWRTTIRAREFRNFREEKRDRWLSTEEIERLCDALDKHPNQSAANAIRLMLLTGARHGEVLTATWEEFNLELGVWTKPSHHTKQKRTEHVPLSPPAVQLLVSMKEKRRQRISFPRRVAGKPIQEIKRVWSALCKQANLKSVRFHDLRHTYASHLVSSGMSLPIVGRLLGHTQPQTTARYAHLADDPLRQATNRFASIVAAARSRKRADVVPLHRDRDA